MQTFNQSLDDLLAEALRPRVIALIHTDGQGKETFLGVFNELPCRAGRRLVPCHVSEECECKEFVTGDYWLAPKPTPQWEDSPAELLRIRHRFLQLLQESQAL